MWNWLKWVFVVLVLMLAAGFLILSNKNKNDSGPTEKVAYSNKTKFEVFPVKFEDFATPAKMYGLWPYGVKGNTSSDHNEGHPGWDFEMKKGSKVYAIADLEIRQIHEGDHSSGDLTPEVIEAYTNLQDGKYHIVYHSVVNLEPKVKEGATIKAGQPLAEVGFPLSETSAMIHFGIFPPHDSVGSCPTPYFSEELQKTIAQILAISLNSQTNRPFTSACVGKINKELYLQNYPDNAKYLGGAEQWE